MTDCFEKCLLREFRRRSLLGFEEISSELYGFQGSGGIGMLYAGFPEISKDCSALGSIFDFSYLGKPPYVLVDRSPCEIQDTRNPAA